jgi:hypothetical protein
MKDPAEGIANYEGDGGENYMKTARPSATATFFEVDDFFRSRRKHARGFLWL